MTYKYNPFWQQRIRETFSIPRTTQEEICEF